ncbi:MAG: hypothetical protein U0231_16225 [Nitrospiraceae bacterium]
MGSIRSFVLAMSMCSAIALISTPLGAQGADHQPSSQQADIPAGGTPVEDLLLQKGVITMDEWIQIRAEQEYRGTERDKRIDALEDWKTKIELLPILRDKVNVGLNALQFLYTHQDAHAGRQKPR